MTTFVTATQARKTLYDIIDRAAHPGFPIAITHEGLPKVVVMSFEEYEGWQETMEIMADSGLKRDLDASIQEMQRGDVVSLEEVKKRLRKQNKKQKKIAT